ncbi:hypothetical protein HNV10_04920 [Winogradskyella litoriviva]|uniref:Lipoprotein n=1 Tax=Winogradskyella litoriviva TaxID=1220182 RepID=A0ABX2E4C7_9FLAO|nr:hypothetical protein [Winogradskyella litoriviva]NRD22571.1 hypothetical protein [Winogradskyella litoriviva]
MGKFILPIFFYFFFSCGNEQKREIPLFDGHIYLLKTGELEINKTQVEVNASNELKNIFNKKDLVLFKAIKHKDYNTYLYIDLDTLPVNKNTYRTKTIANNTIVLYQHMVDSLSEITEITLLKNDKFKNRFSKDSLTLNRFIISIESDDQNK